MSSQISVGWAALVTAAQMKNGRLDTGNGVGNTNVPSVTLSADMQAEKRDCHTNPHHVSRRSNLQELFLFFPLLGCHP